MKHKISTAFGVALLVALMVVSPSLAAPALTNAGFETGDLTGWSATIPLGGFAYATTSYTADTMDYTVGTPGPVYGPVYGSYFALLKTDGPGSYTTISQSFTVSAGDKISGYAFFDAGDYLPFVDSAQVQIKSGAMVVATVFSASVSTVGNGGETPWTYWEHTFASAGTYTVEARVANALDSGIDAFMGLDLDILHNQPPTADAGGPYSGEEGSAITLSGATASDADLDALTYAWNVDSASCSFDDASLLNPKLTCSDNGSYTATLSVDDGVNPAVTSDAAVTVDNVAPTLGAISVDVALVPVNTAINATADFTDPGTLDTHTAAWDWGNGTSAGTVTQGAGSGSVNDSHSYSEPGVYTIKLTVTDNDGAGSIEAIFQFIVVYDPNGGFVTGGGWIDSPENASYQYMQTGGKATFGFVAKYKKGANVPDGNTVFQFKAGDLNFKSSSYEWLVVAGNKAQFKGEGTINGHGNHKFMISADDDSPDTFRIQIWGDSGIVYDNGSQQSLGGGSIVIHK